MVFKLSVSSNAFTYCVFIWLHIEKDMQTFLGVGWSRRDVAAMEMFPQKIAYENGAFVPTEEVRPNETD